MLCIVSGENVLLGLVALRQKLRLKYGKHVAMSTICADESLSVMIPPSIVLITYGLTADTSVTTISTAYIVLGLMLAVGYMLIIIIRSRPNTSLAPSPATPRALEPVVTPRLHVNLAFLGVPLDFGVCGRINLDRP